MGKITGLPQALSFDEGDVLVKDGEHGTKQIPVSEAAKYMGRDTIMVNEQPTEGTKVVIQTTDQEYSLALMSDVDAVDDKVEEVKTQLTKVYDESTVKVSSTGWVTLWGSVVAGEKYTITNNSGVTIAVYSRSSGTTVETFTTTLANGKSIDIIIGSNADSLATYMNSASVGTIEVLSFQSILPNALVDINENKKNISETIPPVNNLVSSIFDGKTTNAVDSSFACPIDFPNSLANRLYTKIIPKIGFGIVISCDPVYKFCVASDRVHNLTGWEDSYTFTFSSGDIILWIKKTDGTNFTDSEKENIYDNIEIAYNIDYKNNVKYISASGEDYYDGSESHPLKTVDRAIELGANTILIEGGKYYQRINCENVSELRLIAKDITNRPIFIDPDRLSITSATLADGVYSADADFSVLAVTPRIFQDGYADVNTLIDVAERLPQERGKQYRCDDTPIKKCASETLADALIEIAGASEYLFFYDSTNKKLYFKAPSSNFSAYPIVCSSNGKFLLNVTRKTTIVADGIECKYMRFDISNSANSVISNCKASCAYASALGQFMYDNALNTRFINCEACLSHGQNNGDGFNSHATNSGDAFAHQSGVVLENCWSHDNMDDGWSDHHRGEATIIGGLYEYNGKGGITPSYGTHVSCYNVVSRYNWNGFLYVAEGTSDGGTGGDMLCVGCVAEHNYKEGYDSSGFKVAGGATNHATLVNCYSIENDFGYYAMSNTRITAIDCYALNNITNAKGGSGTIDIITLQSLS